MRLAVFTSFSGAGGVERMVVNLVREFDRLGVLVDLLYVRGRSAHLEGIPERVRMVPLNARHSFTSVFELARYLRHEKPVALLAAKDRPGRAALRAGRLAGMTCPVVIRLGTNLSAALEGKSWLARWGRTAPMRRLYARAQAVVAVSEGVAEDTRLITGLPSERIIVIRNPVVTPELEEMATAPCPHPWLERPREEPVLLAAGRLTHQKDFATLLQAFAILMQERPVRLIILGEGRLRGELEPLAEGLGIKERVAMPGFEANPYAWMGRVDGFVLSSRWEGSPNVLTEAMALGVPVVATDCPSGPREILQGGSVAPLVPVGDAGALARAMAEILERPPDRETICGAVREYKAERSARRYLEALGVPVPDVGEVV